MQLFALLLLLVTFTGCGPRETGPVAAAMNLVEDVQSRQVVHDGKTWVEVTITQRVDPKAPAYVVGIRGRKVEHQLAGVLFKQVIGAEKVVSYFRFRPVDPRAEVILNQEDFEWHPQVMGFPPVKVVLNEVDPGGPVIGSQPIRSETNRASSAAASRR